jgi:tetratricopeptide (TPR) repeat protein
MFGFAGMLAVVRGQCPATLPLEDRITCVEAANPGNPNEGSTKKWLSKDECQAETSWRSFISGANGSPVSAPSEIAELLAKWCDQLDTVRIGDELQRQGRHKDSIPYYTKVTAVKAADAAPRLVAYARRSIHAASIRDGAILLPPKEVTALEQQQKFSEAYALIARRRPETDGHRIALGSLVAALPVIATFEGIGDYEEALKRLGLLKLESVRDQHLAEFAYSETTRLKRLAVQEADREAISMMNVGIIQMDRGNYAGAATSFSNIVAKKATISPKILAAANTMAVKAREADAGEPTWGGTWTVFAATLRKVCLGIIGWLPYILAYMTPLAAITFLARLTFNRFWIRNGIRLEMEDRSSPLASSTANATLTDQLRREMELPLPLRTGFRIDRGSDDDGSSLGQIRLSVPLRELETAFVASAPLAFGPLSINPIQIIAALKPAFRRRCKYEMSGALSTNGLDMVCRVALDRKPRDSKLTTAEWEGTGMGPETRRQALRSAATQILIDLDAQARKITWNWRSLNALREGMDQLQRSTRDPATRKSVLIQARTCFQDAVLHDPGNWLARFNLGIVLRKMGLNLLAVDQFRQLVNSNSLQGENYCAAKYNLAASLQKVDDERLANEALKHFKELLEHRDLDPTMRWLVESAHIATWADRLARRRKAMERRTDDGDRERFRTRVEATCQEANEMLGRLRAEIEQSEQKGEESSIALAVTLNAVGQLLDLSGRPAEALDVFRDSIAIVPTFVEPYLNLASMFIQRKGSLHHQWHTRAERLLLDVQEVDAKDTRASLLLGTLYAHPVFGRLAEAETQLRAAMPDFNAARRLGSLLLDQGKADDALAPLLSAAELDAENGISHYLLAICVANLKATHPQRCRLLNRAERWLSAQNQPRFLTLLNTVRESLKTCEGSEIESA